ncbi:nitroreductase [Comamonadaceae bacterium OH3737_COT-264]|nr:nitroreductase [Comamonadaceae bacterium OH3737_COT-264]
MTQATTDTAALAAWPDEPMRQQALQYLATRRSRWPLQEPGPDDAALAQIFALGACAPDHAGLYPWRFQYVRGAQREVLLERVMAHPDAQSPEVQEMRSKFARKLTTAPVVMVLAIRVAEHPKVPEFEQFLSCGAAVMNMLNAAHCLGFQGFWSTAPAPLDALLRSVMGFEAQDRMVGILNFGTAAQPPSSPLRRVEPEAFVRAWDGA